VASYLLRKFDDGLWHRVKRRALEDRISLRALGLKLFQMYADGLKLTKEKAK
jgi:hypothetical protein